MCGVCGGNNTCLPTNDAPPSRPVSSDTPIEMDMPATVGGGGANSSVGGNAQCATFVVRSGPCTLSNAGRCVGRPNGYADHERCDIEVSGSSRIDSCPKFQTEENFDWLVLGGGICDSSGGTGCYSGSACPAGVPINPTTALQWISDESEVASGWEICTPVCTPSLILSQAGNHAPSPNPSPTPPSTAQHVTVSVEQLLVTLDAGHTTFRLSVQLQAGCANVYSLVGTTYGALILPPGACVA
jgi:hypothetical protein